jgi:hypothetical protein
MSIAQNRNHDDGLSAQELEKLAQLEDNLGRGEAVKWDGPKKIAGYVVRPVETVQAKDYNDSSRTVEKRVVTLRTATGLVAIWEGPGALEKLFEEADTGRPVIVRYTGEKVGQESGRQYKAFDVVVGDNEAASATPDASASTSPADDDIPW